MARHYRDQGPDGEFYGAVADSAVIEEAFATWRTEIGFAEAWVDAEPEMPAVANVTPVVEWSVRSPDSTRHQLRRLRSGR